MHWYQKGIFERVIANVILRLKMTFVITLCQSQSECLQIMGTFQLLVTDSKSNLKSVSMRLY